MIDLKWNEAMAEKFSMKQAVALKVAMTFLPETSRVPKIVKWEDVPGHYSRELNDLPETIFRKIERLFPADTDWDKEWWEMVIYFTSSGYHEEGRNLSYHVEDERFLDKVVLYDRNHGASRKMVVPMGLAQELFRFFKKEIYDEDLDESVTSKRREAVQTRPISEIAREIAMDWRNVNYAAKPYLQAMFSLNKITDTYIMDSAEGIVLRFLYNASSWRGPVAAKLKAELKAMLR